MTPNLGHVLDESLASVARDLHVAEIAVVALVTTVLLYRWVERRGRVHWSVVPAGVLSPSRAPYRSIDVISGYLARAPGRVRVAAFASLLFGHMFAPLIALAVVRYPFDGISVLLLPGMALALLNWGSAWLLLRRAPLASSAARSGAVGSLMANVGLVAVAIFHFFFVELPRRGGSIEHACSSSVTFLVLVFAVCSVAVALLIMAAMRSHDADLLWTPPMARVAVPQDEPRVEAMLEAERDEGTEVDAEPALVEPYEQSASLTLL